MNRRIFLGALIGAPVVAVAAPLAAKVPNAPRLRSGQKMLDDLYAQRVKAWIDANEAWARAQAFHDIIERVQR